jgi:phospho-N-acetylmuramoyl-pentapeptide-transferase
MIEPHQKASAKSKTWLYLLFWSLLGASIIYLLNNLSWTISARLGFDHPGLNAVSIALLLGVTTFLMAVIWGAPLIRRLKIWKIGKQIRIEEPSAHQLKTGTPTMGGLLIVIPVLVVTGISNIPQIWGVTLIGKSTLLLLGCTVAFALLGAVDDWEGIRGLRAKGEGISEQAKAAFQFLFALCIALVLYFGPPHWDFVGIPGLKGPYEGGFFRIGLWMIPVTVLVIVGFSNAVNFADGLDSLAGSLSMVAFASYGIIAYLQEQYYILAFCFIMVGALLAFLWFNAHPAQVIMGDLGSLALGATLALVALMTGQWLLLPVIGLVFVAEAASVVIQRYYFKWTRLRSGTGRRVFRMAPLHYHFELLGWSETQIKERFWLVAFLGGMLGIALALR